MHRLKRTHVISGALLISIGAFITGRMLYTGLDDWDWFWRTGIHGFLFGTVFIAAGAYTVTGRSYTIHVRVIASALLIALSLIPMAVLLAATQGTIIQLLLVTGAIIVVYGGVVGTTVYDLYKHLINR